MTERNRFRMLLVPCLLAVLAACQTVSAAPPEMVAGHPGMTYLPAQRMTGDLILSFEQSEFQGCWFDATGEAARRLQAAAPDRRGSYRFRVVVLGQRTPPQAQGGARFGHLGMFPCQIRATSIISIENAGTSATSAR